MSGWSFWIDRGGTFTDVVARDPEGAVHVRKLLSENREQYADAPLEGIRRLVGDAPLDAERIEAIRMGTTVATNALLERQGSRVGLVITRGFEDLLEIGTQNRPDLFALEIVKPETLVEVAVGADEQVSSDGRVERRIDLRGLRAGLKAARAGGIDALAVVLKNAYANPVHERAVGALAKELGFSHVGLSHEVVREINLTARGDTTTADAYLTPILREYVDRLREHLDPAISLRFMQSSGGLADAQQFSGKDAIISGPAGGVVACAHVARQAGVDKVIGFDMGGTSTDVCRLDLAEGFERVYERVIAGVRIKAPMLNVSTIAAGGGSELRFDGRKLTVGPESAGADPGPVCYRRPEGRLAVTDANAVLGRVQPEFFPACFGPGADAPLDASAARERMARLAAEVGRTPEQLAAGFVRIANDNMARAIREISVARGYDVSEYALLCFGGAGGQHACSIASSLGMKTVLLHPHGGVLSAYGMGLADVVHAGVHPVLEPLDSASETMNAGFERLERSGRRAVRTQGIAADAIRFVRSADLRYAGVDASLNVVLPPDGDVEAGFTQQHERLYGFARPGHPVEVVTVRLETIGSTAKPPEPEREVQPAREVDAGTAVAQVDVWFDALADDGVRALEKRDTPVYRRDDLQPGARLTGPALITEAVSTVVVDPGWEARVASRGELILTSAASASRERLATERDPVVLEIMGNLYMSIAEQMGATLRRVSLSVNIKERLDFSCAVFDPKGALVANAPHIPVHLGAMSESVRAVLESVQDIRPGDVLLTNDPYHGGSHLPDITVITPVFVEDAMVFFVANRGHHADVGGIVPGSMPPFSRSIEEEGVRLHGVLLVRDGRFLEQELRGRLEAGPWPVRGIDERLADLQAQIASNAMGVTLLQEMVARYGLDVVTAYMGHVQADAAAAMRDAIGALPDGAHRFFDFLDDGSRIAVTVTIEGERARVDFAGTDPIMPGNLNAPRAVVKAAVLYVFRTLIERPVPLNAGCFEPLEIVIPDGCLLDPKPPAAVVGGNVETSQRIVDVLYGALEKLAASQGTMNNLTFGTEAFGYYETICGGAGAGFGFDGASAVHTHMTNTRITDPEVLELRYPVVLRSFRVRRGSGGDGVFRGGDGVVREIEFRAACSAAVLSERRALQPFALHGAEAGAPGRNWLRRGGTTTNLPGKVRLDVVSGDVLGVETPGGGGYDPSPGQWEAMAPFTARRLFREGRWRGPTCGFSSGAVQANLVVLPRAFADDFEAYCAKNPGPCPLLERLGPGEWETRRVGPSDLRTDLPRYRIFAGGGVEEVLDLVDVWTSDYVAFLLGCSFSTEHALLAAGVPVRHIEQRRNVPMFLTNRRTRSVGPFGGGLVVTMRPMPRELVKRATDVSSSLWHGHGGPVHVGDHEALGVADLHSPDWGDAVTIHSGEVPVFWACGVTSQIALQGALEGDRLERCFTHAPGHMLICDVQNADMVGLGPWA